jgi:uncharacterized phage-associated protein
MGTKYTADDIARYFLHKADKDEQELISNLKLQKLVYYAQGLHLAIYGKAIFKEEIKAWNYGPVVPDLYSKYKKHGSKGIPADKSFRPEKIDDELRKFLDEIYSAFGQFSAMRLMDLTHTDNCWKEAHPNKTITHKVMTSDLKKYLKNG